MSKVREIRMRVSLQASIPDAKIYLENESSNHSVPEGSETHFKLLIVTDVFQGLSKLARQRQVLSILDSEFKSGLHALAIRAVSIDEWKNGSGEGFVSPECLGAKVEQKIK